MHRSVKKSARYGGESSRYFILTCGSEDALPASRTLLRRFETWVQFTCTLASTCVQDKIAAFPAQSVPLLGETLKEFFKRTTEYWCAPLRHYAGPASPSIAASLD